MAAQVISIILKKSVLLHGLSSKMPWSQIWRGIPPKRVRNGRNILTTDMIWISRRSVVASKLPQTGEYKNDGG